MASVWSASRGRSHTTVQSAFTSPMPCAPTMAETCASRPVESAPAQVGSDAGKWRPRSPSPAAPSIASATAWATTSASLWPARPAAPGTVTPPRTSGRPGSPENRWTSNP